jgi:small subunit ribosomal protein S4
VTKIVQSKYKISRRLGESLWGNAKDPFLKRNYGPGQHGSANAGGKRKTVHGVQLQAKQKLKGYYNMTEKQFRKFYAEAARKKGNAAENLVGLLERRLDAVVYRLNLAPTIFAARQLVSHKHVLVNGKTTNIPSFLVREGDEISLKPKSKEMVICVESVQKMERSIPSYLSFEEHEMKGKFIRTPVLADIPYPVVMEPHFTVEFYSK